MATSRGKKKRRKQRRARQLRRMIFLVELAALAILLVILIRGRSGKPQAESAPQATYEIEQTAELPTDAPEAPDQAEDTPNEEAGPESPAISQQIAEGIQLSSEEISREASQVQQSEVVPSNLAGSVCVDENGVSRFVYGELPETDPVDDTYFDDAVFVGDSVMQGLYYDVAYKRKTTDPGCFGQAQFLTATSYSIYHAIHDAANSELHPTYRGRHQPVQISIRDMGAKKVYIMLGMNDILALGAMRSLENYGTLVENIRSTCPDVEICILSVIPCTRNAVKKNSKIDVGAYTFFNQRLPGFAAEHDCYFINVAQYYIDSDGYLLSELSSDDYVHIQSGCFGPWEDALRTHTSRPQ